MNMQAHNKQSGFTILELMVATIVFATVLLVCTTALIQIGRVYYKGYTASRTQEVARNIIDDISRSIQFSGGQITEPTISSDPTTHLPIGFFCVDSTRYTYSLSRQVTDNPNSNALVADKSLTCPSQSLINIADSGCNPFNTPSTCTGFTEPRQLVPAGMRLIDLSLISKGNDQYEVKIRVANGDDDLLCSPSKNDCSEKTDSHNLDQPDLACKSISGSQFCAVAELSTTVIKRVQ